MKINISEILSNPSVIKDYRVEPDIESLELKYCNYPISKKSPFTLTVAKEDDKINIKGDTAISLIIPCDRCLDDVETSFSIHIDYSFNPNTESDGIKDENEDNFMDGCMLDVDKLISNEVVVALPTKVLCKEDCKGLCSVCGTNLNHHSCDCDKDVLDPRMAAIQDIFNNFNK